MTVRYVPLVLAALALICTSCSSAQYGGVRQFEVVTTPVGADVYLVPRYDAEQNGWIGMRPRALVAVADALQPYHQGSAPLRVQGNEQAYLLVAISGSRAASKLIHPQPGERVQIILSQ